MKILSVIGARPQFIKALAFSSAVAETDGVEEVLLHTGQHYDDNMSAVFFRELGIPEPKIRLDIGGGRHGEMTGRQLIEIEAALLAEAPDICLVYGDTNSTIAGALAAAKLNIPVAHVEAGLRSFNRRMPEEINRVLTDHMSEWLFTPTVAADNNLAQEGIDPTRVHRVGDVMYDVTRMVRSDAARKTDVLSRIGISHPYVVATVHRQENTDHPTRLRAILSALSGWTDQMSVVLPLHPRAAKMAQSDPDARALLGKITVVEPVGYLDMATLLAQAALVVTDSGGLQKEAYFHGVPCVTVRDETEWVELVYMGWNRLPRAIEPAAIREAIEAALACTPTDDSQPYGTGDAAIQILNILRAHG